MTAVPPPSNPTSNRNPPVDRNTTALGRLEEGLISLGYIISNLNGRLNKADALQVKALATSTTSRKFLEQNNKVLSQMRGDFTENAMELLKNFSDGIRKNSDSTIGLMNRMKITGQDTEAFRKLQVSMLSITGNNIDTMSVLSDTISETSRKSLVSEEKLITAINAMSEDLRLASFVDNAPENIAKYIALLQGEIQGLGSEEIAKSLRFLTSPDFFAKRFQIGLDPAITNDLLSGNASLLDIKKALEKLDNFQSSLVKSSDKNYELGVKSQMLDQLGIRDSMIAAHNMSKLLQDSNKDLSQLRATALEDLDTRATVEGEAKNFYTKLFPKYYEDVVGALGMIEIAVGARAGLGVLRNFGTLLSVMGPIGVLAGGALAMWPLLSQQLENSNDTDKKSLAELEKIRKQNEKKEEVVFDGDVKASYLLSLVVNRMSQLDSSSKTSNQDLVKAVDRLYQVLMSINENTSKTGTSLPARSNFNER